MTQEQLDSLLKNVLESQDDIERQMNLETLADNTRALIKDYDDVLHERDDYKSKYDKANERSIELFMRVQGDKSSFKSDEENQGTKPHDVIEKDKKDDEEMNRTYDDLLNKMKGELF